MSYDHSPASQNPKAWQLVALALGVAFLTAALATFGIVYGLVSGSVAFAVVLRSLLSLLAVVVLTFWFSARWPGGSTLPWAATALGSFLLNPYSWNGKTLFGQFFGPIPVAIAIDLVIWVAVGTAVAWVQQRRAAAPTMRPVEQSWSGGYRA